MPRAELEDVQHEIKNHIKHTLNEKGCLKFSITVDKKNPYKFHVNEEFLSMLDFENHQDIVAKSKWGKLTKNVSRYYKIIEN